MSPPELPPGHTWARGDGRRPLRFRAAELETPDLRRVQVGPRHWLHVDAAGDIHGVERGGWRWVCAPCGH